MMYFENFWDTYPLLNPSAEEVIQSMNADGVTLANGEPITAQAYAEAVQQAVNTRYHVTRHIITADRKHAARLNIYPSGMIDIDEILIANAE